MLQNTPKLQDTENLSNMVVRYNCNVICKKIKLDLNIFLMRMRTLIPKYLGYLDIEASEKPLINRLVHLPTVFEMMFQKTVLEIYYMYLEMNKILIPIKQDI